jgi:hypothetical protein
MKKALLLIVIGLFSFLGNYAQQYPTSATVIMTPPHPVYINDYYGIGSNAFQAILNLNDLNEVTWDVRLKITVEGEGIKLETKPSYIPSFPTTLTSGIPTTLSGSDFASYFNVNNLNLEGITQASLNQSGKLPEGLYNFCVEILDYNSGKPISLTSCQTVFIFFEPPPILLQPACENIVTPSDPQNLYFAWQIAGGASPTIAMNSKYNMKLYEVTNNASDPYFAVENNHALLVYESGFINQTSVTIDAVSASTTPLIAGKKYVWRVRALDGDEKNIYRNNGFSEWCWFYYGYPSDGVIALQAPNDEHVFGKYESPDFGWSSSSLGVPGQQYDYSIVIKELNADQDPLVAMDINPIWYQQLFPTTSSSNGYGLNLTQDFTEGATYVWQVVANTGVQEIARSEVRTFFAPSLLDEFIASNVTVKVVTLNGNDLTDIAGTGRINFSDDPLDFVEFDFEHFNVDDKAGNMTLVSGEAIFDMSFRDSLLIESSVSENGSAHLHFTEGRLNAAGFKVKTKAVWPFPHATADSEIRYVISEEDWLPISSSGSYNGELTLSSNSDYELLELSEFIMTLKETTRFSIINNVYTLSLNGSLAANGDVKTSNNQPFIMDFSNETDLLYFNITNLQNSALNYLKPIDGFGLGISPNTAIVDLSETTSPAKLSGNISWKGVYFSDFLVRFYLNDIDETNQLSLYSDIDRNENLSGNTELWLTNQGLHFIYDYNLDEEGTTFNGFTTTLIGNIEVDNNEINNSYLEGSIKLPVIHKTEEFDFEIPVTTNGLATGYLTQDLTNRELVFNPYGGENRVDITINRAVFAENERIDLEIDAELIGINATVSGIDDFRVYGNNTIGIGGVNGSKDLTNQVSGEYKGFNAQVISVGASLFNGSYVFSYETQIDMGEGVVGEDGPPVLAISSIEPVGSSVDLPAFDASNPMPEPAISIPANAEAGQSSLTVDEMFIAIDNPMVTIEGYIKLTNNDPNWGTSFRGGINGQLKIPAEIAVGSNIIFGDRDGTKFWYFDAYFNDQSGLGVQVPPFFNVVAMEGRAFHHMSKNETEYVVDPNMAFGAALYLQLIDNAQQGALFAIDAGAEIAIQESGDFIFSISGDGSFLNVNRRSAVGGAITSQVAEVVVNEVMEAIGPIEFSQDIGGGTLTVTAENLTKGGISYAKDDYTFSIGGDVGGTPAASFGYSKGDGSIAFAANANGDFDVDFAKAGNNIGLGLEGSNSGYLDFNYDNVTVHSEINSSDATGSLAFGFDDKSLAIGKTDNGGYFDLQLSSDIAFKTGFNAAEESGYLGLQYESNIFDISGNNTTGEGAIALKVDGVDMDFNVNTQAKSGAFNFSAGNTSVSASAVAEKSGAFSFSNGDLSGAIAVDMESQSGLLDYSYDQGNKQFHAEVNNGNEGNLKFVNDGLEFEMYGTTDGEKGGISYKNGNDQLVLNADKPNGSGSILYDIDGNYFAAEVQSDSGSVTFKQGQIDFTVGMTNQGSGAILAKNGSKELNVYANIPGESASIEAIDGSDEYSASTNFQSNSHSLKVKNSDSEFEVNYTPTNQLASYKKGTNLNVYAKNDNGDYEVGTLYDGHSVTAAYTNGIKSIEYIGSGVEVALSEVDVEVKYNGHSVYVSETEIKIDGASLQQLAASLTYTHTEVFGDVTTIFNISGGNITIDVQKAGSSVQLETNLQFNDGSITLNHNGEDYTVYKLSDKYGVAYQDYEGSYENGIVQLSKGTTKQLTVSSTSADLKYNNYEIGVTDNTFNYVDGINTASIANQTLTITRDGKEVYLSEAECGVRLSNNKSLVLTNSSAEINYENYSAGFAMDDYVHYTDGTRSLALSQTGLTISDDNKSLALLDDGGVPEIQLINGNDLFEVSRKGFAVEYAGKRYAVNEDENLKIDIDSDKYIVLELDKASYVQNETSLIIGGSDNFLELKHGDKSIALTQEEKIQYSDNTYTAWLSKDLEAQITDGQRTVGLFSESHYLTYEEGDYGFGIRGGSGGNKPGIDVTAYGNTIYVEGERNADVTVGVSSPDYGEVSFTVNANKDFSTRFINGSDVYGLIKNGDMITPIMGTEPEPPTPEYLSGSGSVEAMDGPQFLTNSIADDAGGSIRGSAELSYNSKTSHLVANAAVEGNSPVCIKGAMALDVSPSRFKLDIGTEAERIEIFPTCSGFGGGGWFGLESTSANTSVDVGVFMGWKASATVEIGGDVCGASLTAAASAELGVSAKADLYPEFSINEVGIWLELYAGLEASYWCAGASGSITIASIYVKGTLVAKFLVDKTNIKGTLEGTIIILDIIEESFDLSFDLDI